MVATRDVNVAKDGTVIATFPSPIDADGTASSSFQISSSDSTFPGLNKPVKRRLTRAERRLITKFLKKMRKVKF